VQQSASKQELVRGVAFDEFLGELKQVNGTGETYLGLLKFSVASIFTLRETNIALEIL